MSATPYPQNLLHSDAAQPLQLNAQVTVPPTGDMELAIAGDASVAGWPVIPVGQKMVVTVARDTAYEKKYLVSSITAGTYVSTFEIVAADREYDGLQPTAAPAGSTVEHTVSAVEMSTVNDHMRAKAAHGSDGDLIDADSAQTLSNKTLTSPAFAGAATSDLPMGGKKVTGLAAGSADGDAVRFGQLAPVYAVGLRVENDSAQSIPLKTETKMTYVSEIDPGGILTSGTVTVPTAGVYQVNAWFEIDETMTDDTFQVRIYQGNTRLVEAFAFTGGNSDSYNRSVGASALAVCAASNTLEARVWQANALNRSVSVWYARFSVVRIGT